MPGAGLGEPGRVPLDPLARRLRGREHPALRGADFVAVVLDVADLLDHAGAERVVRIGERESELVLAVSIPTVTAVLAAPATSPAIAPAALAWPVVPATVTLRLSENPSATATLLMPSAWLAAAPTWRSANTTGDGAICAAARR